MKTLDIEALGRQRAKPSKIKARYSRPTWASGTAGKKNRSSATCKSFPRKKYKILTFVKPATNWNKNEIKSLNKTVSFEFISNVCTCKTKLKQNYWNNSETVLELFQALFHIFQDVDKYANAKTTQKEMLKSVTWKSQNKHLPQWHCW